MKMMLVFRYICILLTVYLGAVTLSSGQTAGALGWKAGIARAVITPEEPMWMAGYGGRDHPAEGIIHDLWAKALVIEDQKGKKGLLITTDLESFPKYMSDRIRNRIGAKYGLTRAQIILNSSHTHSGPVLQGMYNIYTTDPAELEKIRNYSVKLEEKLVNLAGEAIGSLKPALLYTQNGTTRFQVNRRNNNEAALSGQSEINGPNDYAVPVLKVTDPEGNLVAVAFGYACHNTTLSGYQWCGDYAGFAQIGLENLHPGVTAMFFQGAGADQNPLPRRTVTLARQYGLTLAAAVDRVLSEEMKQLSPSLSTAYSEIDLELSAPMARDELIKMSQNSKGYQKRWADDLIMKMDRGEPIISSYPYPVQVWKVGEQPVISMGGELVVEYTIEFKKRFGQDIFVIGYSNDVMAYIPSADILREGGYEGASSQIAFGLPAAWKENIEEAIIGEVIRLAAQAGITQVKQ